MIVGLPKRTRLALPRVARRVVRKEPLATPRPRLGLFASVELMMERQAALIVRAYEE